MGLSEPALERVLPAETIQKTLEAALNPNVWKALNQDLMD